MWFWDHRKKLNYSLSQFYQAVGISKQSVHQYIERLTAYNEEVCYLLKLIYQIRQDHPTMNCKAMYHKLNPSSMGRDAFIELCREHGFIQKSGKFKPYTTNSAGVIRFDNLLENAELTAINQAWSSDITYYEVNGRFYYITFIIDCFSRRILGHQVSERLTTEATTLKALKMAIKNRKKQIPEGIIFHSDGGGQYYDKVFLGYTHKLKFKNSMCEMAYQNGIAERLNGVIKNNYLRFWQCQTLEHLIKNVDRAVRLYNHEKPHSALKKQTPIEFEKTLVHLNQQTTPKMKESLEVNYSI